MEARIKQLEAEKKDLERQVQELKAKAEAIEKREVRRAAPPSRALLIPRTHLLLARPCGLALLPREAEAVWGGSDPQGAATARCSLLHCFFPPWSLRRVEGVGVTTVCVLWLLW